MGHTDSSEHQSPEEIDLIPAPPYEQALHQHPTHFRTGPSPASTDTSSSLSRVPKLFSSILSPAQPAYTALSQHDRPVSDLEAQTQEPATKDASTNATDCNDSNDELAHVMAPLVSQTHVHCEQCTEFELQKEKMKHKQNMLGVIAGAVFILAWFGIIFGSLAWRRR